MNDPIVVKVAKSDNGEYLELLQAPGCVLDPDQAPLKLFQCDMAGALSLDDDDAIRRHGEKLLRSLRQSHGQLDLALGRAFELEHGECRPIYLEFNALPAVESYCWEAMCTEAEGFVSHDPRWPVARVVSTIRPAAGTRKYRAPFKIMAVLSAAGFNPRAEWDALYGAVRQARTQNFKIELHVGTGDEALLDHIEQLRAADPDLFQFPLTTMSALIVGANAIAPHLVHFFCHGSTTLHKPRLEIARLADAADSDIEVSLDDLLKSQGIRHCWLAVLNCCGAGMAATDVPSLSRKLVAGGMQAVIGMRAEVNGVDAVTFSQHLYPSLLLGLRTALEGLGPDDDITIEWSGALCHPRKELNEAVRAGTAALAWTVPAIYVQRTPFQVRRGVETAQSLHDAARDRVIADFLAMPMSPDTRALLERELAAQRREG